MPPRDIIQIHVHILLSFQVAVHTNYFLTFRVHRYLHIDIQNSIISGKSHNFSNDTSATKVSGVSDLTFSWQRPEAVHSEGLTITEDHVMVLHGPEYQTATLTRTKGYGRLDR